MTSMWFLLFLLVDPWGTLSVSGHRCTETRHSGLIERVTFDCSSRNIRLLPVNISSRATELNLANNNISVVPKNAFRQLPNLTRLDLSRCSIYVLEKECFTGLLRLQTLIMERNCFDAARLPRDMFAGLTSLRVLAIARQYISTTIPVAILDDLKELRTLSVNTQDIPLPEVYGKLPKLTTLELVAWWNRSDPRATFYQNNPLAAQTYAAIRHSNVHTLMIRGAASIPTSPEAFSNFKNLRTLNFACSKIVNIRETLMSFGRIVNSPIDTIILDGTYRFNLQFLNDTYDINDFCDGPLWKNLRRLSVRNIGLKTFVPRDVNCLPKLQELSVGYNSLSFTPSNNSTDSRHLASLHDIDMAYSNRVGPGFRYKYCRSCSVLFQAEYFLPRVPRLQSVVNSPILDTLVTDDTYPPNFFLPHSVRYVDASSSVFNLLSSYVKVLSFSRHNSVLFLNVSGAHILSRVNGLLVGLTQLQVLDASDGVVESIHPDFLRHLPLLRVLNQSHNSLGNGNNNFSSIFSFGRTLEDVDLSDNNLKYIDPSSFSECTSLKKIKLRHNTFRSFHIALDNLTSLDLLDISENRLPYLNESFTRALDKLRETKPFAVDLRRNQFSCNCASFPFIRWLQTTSVDIVGRTDMKCLFQSSWKRLMDVSERDLPARCNRSHLQLWLYGLVGVLVVILMIATIAVVSKCFLHRRSRNPLVYLALNTYARGG